MTLKRSLAVAAAALLLVTPAPALSQSPTAPLAAASASPSAPAHATPTTPVSELHSAVVTCTSVKAWIWNRLAGSPIESGDAPFLFGSQITVVDGVNPAINRTDSMFYETTAHIIELGPNLLPHYYIPRACVTITGPATPHPR